MSLGVHVKTLNIQCANGQSRHHSNWNPKWTVSGASVQHCPSNMQQAAISSQNNHFMQSGRWPMLQHHAPKSIAGAALNLTSLWTRCAHLCVYAEIRTDAP
eukprot:6175261-Pleurochrysis_carterae.AAC.2